MCVVQEVKCIRLEAKLIKNRFILIRSPDTASFSTCSGRTFLTLTALKQPVSGTSAYSTVGMVT